MTGTPETGQLSRSFTALSFQAVVLGVYPGELPGSLNRGDGAEGPWRLGWPELAGQIS